MSRGSRHSVGALSLMLVLSVIAATALADQPVPKNGVLNGYTSQGSPYHGVTHFTVSKSGRAVTLEIVPIGVSCEINGSSGLQSGAVISSKDFKPTGKADPLAIVKGKFSYNGPIYGVLSVTGKGQISGTFQSPTKIVGSARFSWPSSTVGPGLEGPCDSGKITFSATHE
jgi:hypothetical protein